MAGTSREQLSGPCRITAGLAPQSDDVATLDPLIAQARATWSAGDFGRIAAGYALDGNPRTDADPAWKPLLSVNHPEYPSGHGFWSAAVVASVAAFFGTHEVTWTIVTSKAAVPALVDDERTYDSLVTLLREIENARIWAGLHWRDSMRDGMVMGWRVASHVTRQYFRPLRP